MAFPEHVFAALDTPPTALEQRIGGVVTVVVKRPERGPVTMMTSGASLLPTDSGERVELAVECVDGQEGAAQVALQIVCDDMATNRRVPPLGTPWRNSVPFLQGTRDDAVAGDGVGLRGNAPVFLSKLHAQHPPRWLTFTGTDLQSVTGLESPEYMDDATNHEVWSVDSFVARFPFVEDFIGRAEPGQTALFTDASGTYALEDE